MLDLAKVAAVAARGDDAEQVRVDKGWLRQALAELAAGRDALAERALGQSRAAA
jgi:hypothetical protein